MGEIDGLELKLRNEANQLSWKSVQEFSHFSTKAIVLLNLFLQNSNLPSLGNDFSCIYHPSSSISLQENQQSQNWTEAEYCFHFKMAFLSRLT